MAKKKIRVKKKVGVRKKKVRRKKKPLTLWQKAQKKPELLYGACAVLALLAYMALSSESSPYSISSVAPSKNKPELNKLTMERVNDHMRNMDLKRQIQEQKIVVENDENAPRVGEHPDNLFPDPVHPHGVVMLEESDQSKVIEEIGEGSKKLNIETNPEEKISANLERERFLSDYNQKLEQAQVEEFLARARADGWEVKLNADLQIVSARRIKPKH